jgi:putative oxidoreductase
MNGKASSITHAILRIGTGLLFMQHGLQKIFGLLGGVPPSGYAVPLASELGLAGVLELGGGLLLIGGLATRPVAVLLLLEMIVAFSTVHMPLGGWPVQNGGEPALLYAIIFGFLALYGAGPASADSYRRTH